MERLATDPRTLKATASILDRAPVVGQAESVERDSFYGGILDFPHYTRPPSFRGMDVPPVLLSGNHADIERWRRKEALRITKKRRPDLLAAADLSEEDEALLREIEGEGG